MSFSQKFKSNLLDINNESFEESSIAAFEYQYKNCSIYNEYCDHLGRNPGNTKTITEIPFLPIEFFKSHKVKSGKWKEVTVFKSSGTTKTGRSQHYVRDLDFYLDVSSTLFQRHFGSLGNLDIIALLPSYLEQGDSSLICMVDHLIKNAGEKSDYYKKEEIADLSSEEGNKVIIGVAYALVDAAKNGMRFPKASIIETGGMKGRGKEITRQELHSILREGFKVESVWSEYGMTELFSQAYGTNGMLKFPAWAQALIRDTNDPFSYVSQGNTGGLNIIDLANIDTCCFIETKDLARLHGKHFEVLGRFDNSDIRGCNQLF